MVEIPPPPWRTQRRAGSGRRPLSQDAIVETALRVLDAEGLDAVSMRRVAEELNTGAASLYAHVANKDELLDLVYDRVMGEITLTIVPDPARWQEQVRELARASFEVLSRHNDIAKVSLANVPVGPNTLRLGEMMLSVVLAGGVPAQAAAWAVDRIALYISADAYEGTLYNVRRQALGLSVPEYMEHYFGRIAAYYRSLPTEQFPALVANVDTMMNGDGQERFDFGLDMIIQGLAGYVGKDVTAAVRQVAAQPPAAKSPAGEPPTQPPTGRKKKS
jgi:AcrR family transcriptional regulator